MRRALAHYFVPAPPASPGPGPLLRMTEGGREFRFRTAPGVFSRGRVDRGSRLLLQAARLDGARRILDLGCGYGVLGIVAAARALGEVYARVAEVERGGGYRVYEASGV